MEHTERISWTQLAGLIVATKLTGTLTYAYIVKGVPFGEESWIVPFFAGGIAILMALLAYKLSARFPRETVFQYSKKIMGKGLGWIVNLFIVLFLINWGGISIRHFTEFYVSVQYVDTPAFVFTFTFSLLAVQIVRSGVEVLGRQGVIMSIFVIFAGFLIFFGSLNRWELAAIPAPWDVNMLDVIVQSYTPIGVFGEMSWIILLLLPYLNQYHLAPRAIIFSTTITALMVSFAAVVLMAVLGEELIVISIFPSYELATAISFGEVVERIEYVVTVLWMGSMIVKLSILLFGATSGLETLFKIKKRNYAIWIAITLMVIWSYLIFENIYDLEEFLRPSRWLVHALPLQIGIPGILLFVAMIRHVRGIQNGVSN